MTRKVDYWILFSDVLSANKIWRKKKGNIPDSMVKSELQFAPKFTLSSAWSDFAYVYVYVNFLRFVILIIFPIYCTSLVSYWSMGEKNASTVNLIREGFRIGALWKIHAFEPSEMLFIETNEWIVWNLKWKILKPCTIYALGK